MHDVIRDDRRLVRNKAAVATATALAVFLISSSATAQAIGTVASRAGCSAVKEGQQRTIRFQFEYEDSVSRVDSNGYHSKTVLSRVRRAFGKMVVRAATCKVPGGRWRVLDPVGVGYSSVGVDATGRVRSEGHRRGWAIGLRSGRGGSKPRMNVQVMRCGQSRFFSSLKSLADIPIPGISYAADVIKFAFGRRLPKDAVSCRSLGTVKVSIGATRSGRLRIYFAQRTTRAIRRASDPIPGYGRRTHTRGYTVLRPGVSRR